MEEKIILFIAGKHYEWFDHFSEWLGNQLLLTVLWLLILLLIYIFDRKKVKAIFLISFLAWIIHLFITELIIKNIYFRPRPYLLIDNLTVIGKKFTDSAFPSGHVASTVAFLFVLCVYNKKFIIPSILFSLIMAWSRIYNGLHWPSDTLIGMFLGLSYGYLAILILRKFYENKSL